MNSRTLSVVLVLVAVFLAFYFYGYFQPKIEKEKTVLGKLKIKNDEQS